jgi:hypothetical protein
LSRTYIAAAVPEVNHRELGQNDFVEPGSVYVQLRPFLAVLVNDVLLNDVQEVCVCDPHKYLLYFLLRVEVLQTVGPILLLRGRVSEPQLVNVVTHVQHSCIGDVVLYP